MRFYFFLRPYFSPAKAGYAQTAISLAQGLQKLGHSVHSNVNYWRKSPKSNEYLFQHNPDIKSTDCDVKVLHSRWIDYEDEIPDNFFNSEKINTVYMDQSDGAFTPAWSDRFREFDFILKNHMIKERNYPSNFEPWAFGLTRRVIKQLKNNTMHMHSMDKKILVNFRVDHHIRKVVREEVIAPLGNNFEIDNRIDSFDGSNFASSYDKLMWEQTGRRHYPSYYQRLYSSLMCAAFGGFFMPPPLFDTSPWLLKQGERSLRIFDPILKKINKRSKRIHQWDSFRFWESLAAGCVTLHVDFDKYGFDLPVEPVNGKHYIGVDLDKPDESIGLISKGKLDLLDIAKKGKRWAVDNYSPKKVAERFLKLF